MDCCPTNGDVAGLVDDGDRRRFTSRTDEDKEAARSIGDGELREIGGAVPIGGALLRNNPWLADWFGPSGSSKHPTQTIKLQQDKSLLEWEKMGKSTNRIFDWNIR